MLVIRYASTVLLELMSVCRHGFRYSQCLLSVLKNEKYCVYQLNLQRWQANFEILC